MVGQEIPLKFLEVDQAKNRLVVSNRRAVVETQMRDLNPGEVVTGVVRGIKPYGAFIDIGGVSGLLHISQISHDHISDIESVLTVGSEIKAMVISQVRMDTYPIRLSLASDFNHLPSRDAATCGWISCFQGLVWPADTCRRPHHSHAHDKSPKDYNLPPLYPAPPLELLSSFPSPLPPHHRILHDKKQGPPPTPRP